ncbi:MAG: alpha/beta hydrolase [Pseudomonadota bacterium]
MMRPTVLIASLVIPLMLGLSACAEPASEESAPESVSPVPDLMSWSDLTSRPLSEPTSSHAYGDDPAQIVDLWRPDGEGPHPVVLMIHGGCWQKAIADRTLMNYAAHALRQRGLAVWNIEYRGVDEAGGGYPGTFRDVSEAAQALLDQGPSLSLDTDHIVAFGHSAGGHLAVWLASQTNLDPDSVVNTGHTITLKAVINSGGLADLEASLPVTLDTCLANIVDDLTGLPSEARPDVFSDTSPATLLPSDSLIISVNGDRDRIAPPGLGESLTALIREAGGHSEFVEVPETGHVELIAPGTPAFDLQAETLLQHVRNSDG